MKHYIRQFFQREAHPVIQFIKYAIGGCTAAGVDILIFSLLAWLVFPAFKSDELFVRLLNIDVPVIDEVVRSWNYGIDKTIAFLFSNFIAYIINIYWVFEPGRHSRRKEIFLFYVVSIIAFLIGTLVGVALIRFLNWSGLLTYIANAVAAILVNYTGRKYLIFKG